MPLQPLQGARQSAPIRAYLPTKEYPHLKQLIKEIDFMCPTCTSGEGKQIWYNFDEARLEPAYGPGKYTTEFGCFCGVCGTILEGPLVDGGRLDLMRCPSNYKRPKRAVENVSSTGIVMDDEDDNAVVAPVRQEPPREIKTKKKTSDLSPKTRNKKPKGAVKAALNKAEQNAGKA